MSVRRREYKLHYFDARGRGEVSRLILAHAKVPYEDIRYSFADWPQQKSKMPFGQLPVLEWKGQLLPQSNAIERFLARRHGLVGKNEWEEAQVDAYVALIADATDLARPVYMAREDPEKMKEALDVYLKATVEPLLQRLEQRLIENGSGFLVGDKLTWADLVLFNTCGGLRAWGAGAVIDAWPHVNKLCTTVGEIPTISDWIKKRPITAM